MWIFGWRGASGFSANSTAEQVTQGVDGSELTAIVTGHFLLTNLLLDNMNRTAHNCKKEGRIVNVSSEIHRYTYKEGILLDKINDSSSYNGFSAYGQSKLANMLHANELARRFKEDGVQITANSLHPGVIATKILRNNGLVTAILNYVATYFIKNIAQGASTQCYVALNPQVEGVSGEYFADNNIGKPSALAKDEDLAKKLWDLSLKLTESS